METRSKVAAAAASVVPFHCVICFDEFNLTDRTPMVLPCGHTYVCCQCTRRLKRCMECREPLFVSVPKAALGAAGMHLNNHHAMRPGVGGSGSSPGAPAGGSPPGTRHHYQQQSTTLHLPPSQMGNTVNSCGNNLQIPLPVPKNVVLMAMMEAAQRQHAEQSSSSSAGGGKDQEADDDEEEEEEFNLDRIISGLSTLSGPCGTYSVADERGLALYEKHPRVFEEEMRSKKELEELEEKERQSKAAAEAAAAKKRERRERVTVEEEKKVEVERETSEKEGDGNTSTTSSGGEDDDVVMNAVAIECGDMMGDDEDGKGTELTSITRTSLDEDEDEEKGGGDEEHKYGEDDDEDDEADASSTDNNVHCSGSFNALAAGPENSKAPPPPPPPRDEEQLPLQQPLLKLRKGQTVQVVDFQGGVAKLARGKGYIVAKSSQLVKVGGPLETCCRLEGLLDTIESRGRDLQSTLDENRQIEASLRGQINSELEKEPCHPVIVELPDHALSSNSRDSDSSQPLTPTGDDRHKENASLRTPDKSMRINRDSSLELPGQDGSPASALSDNNGGYRSGNRPSPACPRSPSSIDNADIARSGIPGYRRAVSEDDLDSLSIGCGVALMGQGSGLWGTGPEPWEGGTNPGLLRSGEQPQHPSSDDGNPSTRVRPRTMTDSLMMHATPTLTSSFDGIDFRTGLSGHRGLSNAAKPGHSPTPHGRQVRFMMSQHCGIGRVRPVPQANQRSRNSPTSTSQSERSAASAPSFGPRFSPFPGT